jgi:tetratricopeptide (TPR) repeat protein
LILNSLDIAIAQDETTEMKEWLKDNALALKEKDTARIIKNYKYIGDGYAELENYAKSNYYLNQGLIWSVKAKAHIETGKIYNLLANNASYNGERQKALGLYMKSLEAFTKINDLSRMAMAQMNIGTEYAETGDYKKAIEWELKSLKTKEKSEDTENIGYFYQKVGELFKEIDIDKWEYYVKKAYSLKVKPDAVKPNTLVAIYNDLGGINHKRLKYGEAYAWYDSMYCLSKEYDYEAGMSTALSNRSLVLKDEKKYDQALKDILESIKISEKTGRKFSIITDNIHASGILLDLNRPREAFKHCCKALDLAQNSEYPEQESDALRLLAKIEERNGNWKNAYYYLKSYKQTTDSLKNAEVQKSIEELETKYQTAEKEQKIAILDKDNQIKSLRLTRTKSLILALIVLIIISAGVVYLFIRRRQLKNIALQTELKQKLLRSQMNPHFTFNTLNAINNYIQSKEVAQASDYLAQYSRLIRQILENSAVEQISLEEEINFLHNYISMQKLRFGNTFDYEIETGETIDPEEIEIPPMITQPFIENAIEHGFRGMKKEGKLKISFTLEDKKLLIVITDNGKGFDLNNKNEEKEARKSFALDITRERLLIKSGDCNSLNIQSPVDETGRGTRVYIRIPINIK